MMKGSGEAAAEISTLASMLIEAGKRLDQHGLAAGTEGNVSARLGDGSILISASGTYLGRLCTSTLVRVSADGLLLDDHSPRPTSELSAHLTAYSNRSDIGTVIHAHTPHALALMLRGEGLDAVPLAEAAYAFGSVPTCEFAVPGTDEGGKTIERWIGERDALLLDRHGALTVGRTVDEALARMEMLDAVARAVLLAGGAGALRPLEPSQVQRIHDAALKAGVREEAIRAWRDRVPVTG
jgi:L-fuculose-phosphate aldolase